MRMRLIYTKELEQPNETTTLLHCEFFILTFEVTFCLS